MNTKPFFAALLFVVISAGTPANADSIEEDFTTICGWYKSLATEEKFKDFSTEKRFTFVFDPKTQNTIKNIQLKSFYSALRTTQAEQRYEFIKAYAEGTLGKNWDCPPMQKILNEFVKLDPIFQYAK